MEKIERIDDVHRLLKDKEVVMILQEGTPIFFVMRKDKILVKSISSTYRITFDELTELFGRETFYLHEDVSHETVNTEKDEEYYAWRERHQ